MNDQCPPPCEHATAWVRWPTPSFRALYEELDAEVARLGPVCQLSGRCCRFKEYGHTLFVSTPEVQLLLEQCAAAAAAARSGRNLPVAGCSAGTAPHAIAGHWVAAFITATQRTNRPRHDLSERYIARLKELTDKHGLPGIMPRCIATSNENVRGSYSFLTLL